MCGIVGVVGRAEAAIVLSEGLKRLEYRGYDSAGVATLIDGRIERRRAKGKLTNLEQLLRTMPLDGSTGIGHTRWATHGVANETNAHPHATQSVALVHNGIIENYRELREELTAAGHVFESQTDTEAAVQLITHYLDQGYSPEDATRAALDRLEGAFALGILFAGHEDLLIAARRGSPLVIGWGEDSMYLGSDAMALAPFTDRVTYLRDGDWAVLRHDGAEVRDAEGAKVTPEVRLTAVSGAQVGKGNFRHFMQKEIYEQPSVIGETLNTYFNPLTRNVLLPALPFDLAAVPKITIVACGTAYLAGAVAKYWFEQIAKVPVEIDMASEFRYRGAPLPKGGLAVFVSQSGETADTLAALCYAREQGQHIVTVVNVAESTMAREADVVLRTQAGPEIGVCSTKAFTCQLVVLACLALAAGVARGALSREDEERLCGAIAEVPTRASEILNHDDTLRELAAEIAEATDVLYIGRGTAAAIALEGALKLKEISYIHAEGFPAGELKHGPIALIDETVPVIVLAPSDAVFAKTASNMEEVIARGGKVVLVSDERGIAATGKLAWRRLTLPAVDPFVAPILYAIPVQLLAYHVAVHKGTDVDQPRNLAKSVTVE
ncbi:MAG: glutamine--fructose-6-phosphate transaminase (isomerizing) [Alphaproteobacteria bacterium]|nr:glutamine--fructose-6-phosphate transaminase (isomerizing) [Alphaproteobacteria bacterium]